MTGWLIYDKKQYDINKWFADEIIKYCSEFCSMKLIIVERLKFGILDNEAFVYDGIPAQKPDFAIVRTIYPLLSFFMESLGVRLFNQYAISKICNDKRLTYTLVSGCGIPIMPTVFHDRRFFSADQINESDFPLVLKSVSGHGGKEVFLINDINELEGKIQTLPTDDFLTQKVCGTVGRDLRVYVMGGKIIGSVLRSSDSFKSNFSLGGKAEYYTLSDKEESDVNSVIDCLSCLPDLVGIDFLPDDGRLVFNEIEDVVGTRMLYQTTNINVALEFSKYIKENI